MWLRNISKTNGTFLLKKTFYLNSKVLERTFYVSPKVYSDEEGERENPLLRTFRVLAADVLKPFSQNNPSENTNKSRGLISGIPTHADVVIIGGGAIGSSIAYWLKEKTNEHAFSVLVIEKDLTYKSCSTCLSVGGLKQQFSLPENIQMSLYGAEFLRTLKKRFGPEADVNFTPHGYLTLASEEGAHQLMDNSKLQKELGAVNLVLQKHQIKERFPWMNVDDVALGCLGLEKEGWFNPWSLLQLLKNGAEAQGTQYINANFVDFMFEEKSDLIIEGINQTVYEHPRQIVIETPSGETKRINFAICIIAAGAESGNIAERLKIGIGNGILAVPLPIERRKRFVYSFACQDGAPSLNTPMTMDHTGAHFRRDGLGGDFIGGFSSEYDEEPETSKLHINEDLWYQNIRPIFANRVPAFNAAKIKSGWSGFYEYNRFDENGIVGPHPYYTNIYISTGFSGYGIQQSPAAGRAIAELILDGKFQTIDLTRLGFDRLLLDKPMYEAAIF